MSSQPVAGFRFSATAANIRKDGRIDLALAVADEDATAVGVFTRNIVRAAPVEIAAERLRSGRARAVLVNSGCANACTGEPGRQAALTTTAAVARELGIAPQLVIPASTGVIGQVLPAERVVEAGPALIGGLTADGYDRFSQAICTTDRWPKLARRELPSGGTLLGIAKGAGMIHPDLGPPHATMLAFLFTDAAVERARFSAALMDACERTFNACTVDGDTSTNDCVIAFSSHRAPSPTDEALAAALIGVCGDLARSMVADGEGTNHVAEIRVRGLRSASDARIVSRTVATSLLVKTALFGKDANWGRLLAAAGRAGVPFDPSVATIAIGGVPIVENGLALGKEAELRAAEVLAQPSYTIEIGLGSGAGEFSYLTSDLGHSYVDVNAGYRS
jgi:glutamate N-acetyltransferase/amino-acid N-acetyltransferase